MPLTPLGPRDQENPSIQIAQLAIQHQLTPTAANILWRLRQSPNDELTVPQIAQKLYHEVGDAKIYDHLAMLVSRGLVALREAERQVHGFPIKQKLYQAVPEEKKPETFGDPNPPSVFSSAELLAAKDLQTRMTPDEMTSFIGALRLSLEAGSSHENIMELAQQQFLALLGGTPLPQSIRDPSELTKATVDNLNAIKLLTEFMVRELANRPQPH